MARAVPAGMVLRHSSPRRGSQLPFNGNARLTDQPFDGRAGDGLTHQPLRRRPGAALDGLPTAISEAQGWCRMIAYIFPYNPPLVTSDCSRSFS